MCLRMKASNSGMNPEHEQLAQKECEEVVRQGLIEPDRFLVGMQNILHQQAS